MEKVEGERRGQKEESKGRARRCSIMDLPRQGTGGKVGRERASQKNGRGKRTHTKACSRMDLSLFLPVLRPFVCACCADGPSREMPLSGEAGRAVGGSFSARTGSPGEHVSMAAWKEGRTGATGQRRGQTAGKNVEKQEEDEADCGQFWQGGRRGTSERAGWWWELRQSRERAHYGVYVLWASVGLAHSLSHAHTHTLSLLSLLHRQRKMPKLQPPFFVGRVEF